MNFLKQILCIKSNKVGVEDNINGKINKTAITNAKTINMAEQNADFMDVIDSNLISSDLSDNNLADSTESLSLNDDFNDISDNTSTKDKECQTFNPGETSKIEVMSCNDAQDSPNVNVRNFNEDDVKVNCFNLNDNFKLLHEKADGLGDSIMSINENEDAEEFQETKMDLDDDSTNNISEEKPEEPYKTEPSVKIDDNNADVITQFIENNIVDFVQTPRDLTEILSSLIDFDITPNNSFQVDTLSDNNNLKTSNDDYVLMDLDAIVDKIESIDAFIDNITNTHNMEVLNAIESEDVDDILNKNLNDNTPLLSDIDLDFTDVSNEKTELQDFELQIDLVTKYDFKVQVDVENVSFKHCDSSSQDTGSVIIIADSQNNSFVDDKNDTCESVIQLPNAFADQKYNNTFINGATNPINNVQMDVETISSVNSNNFSEVTKNILINADHNNNTYVKHDNETDKNKKAKGKSFADKTNKNTIVKATISNVKQIIKSSVNQNIRDVNANIIDTIILSSSDDDEEDFPLAILKKKIINNPKTTHIDSDHISISSNDSKNTNKDDPNYCSGYESSDFEFITESEAKQNGIITKKHSKTKTKQPSKRTFEIQSIERLNSNELITEYLNKKQSLSHNFGANINEPGPSGLSHNPNIPGPSRIKKYKIKDNETHFINKELNNTAGTVNHEIPEGDDYLNLFRGIHERIIRPNPYSLENKSVYEPNPSIPGMYIEIQGVGFNLSARQNQPYEGDIDDVARAEAKENLDKILELYPEDNKKIKKKR